MPKSAISASFFGSLVAVTFAGSLVFAQESRPIGSSYFAPPKRILADQKPMGQLRSYPSPVLEDMNGDGLSDIVIGDLPGYLTVALRLAGHGPPRFGPEKRLSGADGKDLKFNNW
jgi:hypothetical protein